MARIPRTAARVVLVDPAGAFLLIKARDPDVVDGPVWWHVPGGGLDPGETPEQAACREVAEEVGLALADVGLCRATRTIKFTFAGRDYVQYESFFLVHLPERVEVDSSAWSDVERRSTLDWRWWSRDELRSTRETVYPSRLGAWLDEWTRLGQKSSTVRAESSTTRPPTSA